MFLHLFLFFSESVFWVKGQSVSIKPGEMKLKGFTKIFLSMGEWLEHEDIPLNDWVPQANTITMSDIKT